jgi:hypothetical protein
VAEAESEIAAEAQAAQAEPATPAGKAAVDQTDAFEGESLAASAEAIACSINAMMNGEECEACQ